MRQTAGRHDGARCLKVFVSQKRPSRALDAPAPAFLTLPASDIRIPIDVEALPPLLPRGGVLPSGAPGADLNAVKADRQGAPWGSYGYLMRHRFDGRTYLVGSGHVLAGGPEPQVGDRLMISDGTGNGRPAARLVAWTTPVPSEAGYPNTVDAALAEIVRPEAAARLTGRLPTGVSGDIRSGMHLHLTGAASGRQRTMVVCERATLAVDADVPGLGRRRVGFRDQALCRAVTRPGDSGGSLLNDRGRAVGLHGWGNRDGADEGRSDISVFTPIAPVLDTFAKHHDLDLLTDMDVITMPLDRPPVDDLDDAIDLVARTLYGEARREPAETRFAIAEVVYNRAIKRSPRFGLSVEAVCRQPDQFSCWNPGDPNRGRTLSISLKDPEIADCVTIARDLVAGRVGGLTLGADHFHHRRVSPYYSREHAPCAQIGNYVFFNDIP
ncbi:cell wall hydrolase [Thalassobaculum sp. OXR-137]|uniref:cell wall hydrolase n=1 Tax=Thalassobaculum sp. OXR-137 TaxID=3100173 RepID=UPI002AC96057|nr:cell wall hydrolase [Thalassobaculum sp. OXR-137]WPZ33474.1 cell wall hydrolase [Thalassobaculum sp. OXR-137]